VETLPGDQYFIYHFCGAGAVGGEEIRSNFAQKIVLNRPNPGLPPGRSLPGKAYSLLIFKKVDVYLFFRYTRLNDTVGELFAFQKFSSFFKEETDLRIPERRESKSEVVACFSAVNHPCGVRWTRGILKKRIRQQYH
jgi:hypothetical protein